MLDEFGFPSQPDADYDEVVLETFVYCSRAAESVDDAEVDRLIELAQRRNVDRGITGVLVFGSGIFFQMFEGPPVEVQKLIDNLRNDPRHHDIVQLDRSLERRERLYAGWEMERVDADDIREVLEEALASADDETNIAALKRTLAHLETGSLAALGRH